MRLIGVRGAMQGRAGREVVLNEYIIVRLCARQVRLLDKVLGRYGNAASKK
jgi:hypothetical protein